MEHKKFLIAGVLFTLIIGSYAYTYHVQKNNKSNDEKKDEEDD